MPVRRAALPGPASYPGPAEGCRLLQPCRASIRGRGKRPVSPSHHKMPQPDRRNQGSLSAVLARLQPRFIFFPSRRATSPLRPAPLLTLPCPRQRSPSASASQNFLLPGASIPRSADVPSWLSDGFRSPPPAWLPPSLALFARAPCCPPALVPRSPLSLTLFLPLRSAPFPWLPLPLADCYAVCS